MAQDGGSAEEAPEALLTRLFGAPPSAESRYYVHIPGISLCEASSIEISSPALSLCKLPFETWAELDRWFASRPEQYRKAEPVFAVTRDTFSEEEIAKSRDFLYIALTALSGARLDHPRMSITYNSDLKGSVRRTYGMLGRGAILSPRNNAANVYGSDQQVLDAACALLARRAEIFRLPEIVFAVEALERGAMVSLGTAEDVTMCAIAIEELVIPQECQNLRSTFARRAKVLLDLTRHSGSEGQSSLTRVLYDVRSEFLHGVPPVARVDSEILSRSTRSALAAGVILIAQLLDTGAMHQYSPDVFGALLDDLHSEGADR